MVTGPAGYPTVATIAASPAVVPRVADCDVRLRPAAALITAVPAGLVLR